jgi:hypothetical protein
MGNERMKPDHNGAKNGGGFWGTRAEAKTMSKKRRRSVVNKITRKALEEADKGENLIEYASTEELFKKMGL